MAWSGSKFEESMPNTLTHALGVDIMRILFARPDIRVAKLATWSVGPDVNREN